MQTDFGYAHAETPVSKASRQNGIHMTGPAPKDEEELRAAIAAANADRTPLRLVGGGSKAKLGRPSNGSELSLALIAGVTLYEPEELVFSARAGTALRDATQLLAAHGQRFAFEPINYDRLLGVSGAPATLGGMVAVGASGPRRIAAGGLRDHLLGFRGVNGRGEVVKSGGRVMKNVTGYDLSKLVAGSFGTLVALSEVTFKVLPKPEFEQTLLLTGLSEAEALAALRQTSGAPLEASGLAMLPKGAKPLGLNSNVAAIRLEGTANSVTQRLQDLQALLVGESDALNHDNSRLLWEALRDGEPVAATEGQIWRASVAPTNGFAFVCALRAAGAPLVSYFYDWAGGLIWLCLEEAPDAHAALVRSTISALGGHATLVRARDEIRARVDVFQPHPPALASLTRAVKESFDPGHILERGRLRAEF